MSSVQLLTTDKFYLLLFEMFLRQVSFAPIFIPFLLLLKYKFGGAYIQNPPAIKGLLPILNLKSYDQHGTKSTKYDHRKIQYELSNIFGANIIAEEKLNSFIDLYHQDFNSINIMTLFHLAQKRRVSLNDYQLRRILQQLLNRSETDELSDENILSLVRFSKDIRSPPLQIEMWKVILRQVLFLSYFFLLLSFFLFCIID